MTIYVKVIYQSHIIKNGLKVITYTFYLCTSLIVSWIVWVEAPDKVWWSYDKVQFIFVFISNVPCLAGNRIHETEFHAASHVNPISVSVSYFVYRSKVRIEIKLEVKTVLRIDRKVYIVVICQTDLWNSKLYCLLDYTVQWSGRVAWELRMYMRITDDHFLYTSVYNHCVSYYNIKHWKKYIK